MKEVIFFRLFIGGVFLPSISHAQIHLRNTYEYTYINGCENKIYRREFLSDSVFVEKYFSHLNKVTQDSQFIALDTFKVINDTWSYMLKGQYYPFFSKKSFKKKEIVKKIFNTNNQNEKSVVINCVGYLPYKRVKIGGKRIYVYKVNYDSCNKEDFEVINISYLYFDPDFGFVRKTFWTCGDSNVVLIK